MTTNFKKSDCVFCRIVAGELPATVEYEDDLVIAFRDIRPKAEIHLICVPKKHLERLTDFRSEDHELWLSLLRCIQRIAGKLKLAGFKLAVNNGESAGQVVPHVHIHLLAGRKIGEIFSI